MLQRPMPHLTRQSVWSQRNHAAAPAAARMTRVSTMSSQRRLRPRGVGGASVGSVGVVMVQPGARRPLRAHP